MGGARISFDTASPIPHLQEILQVLHVLNAYGGHPSLSLLFYAKIIMIML